MSWIRRETEKGTVQYICPRCHDYHEFREDFGERTFSENYIFCRRCGARNGTGNAPTLTPPNEWVSVDERLPGVSGNYICAVKDKNGSVWTIPAEWSLEMKMWIGAFGEIKNIVTHWMPLPVAPDRRPPEGEEKTR